ncbi:phosphatase PAP2 family protein [Pseudomonas syringae]|uniref:PAP2 superfamily protein n=2 Tax=Pseudomonas syringae TaxID=317 RepID=A0A0P9HLJ2_PSESX|nr:phosphatase PAP2 family protein [Pseudomonas syringae]KPW16212.1 PAP2 superfamily protein [Pseudomonas syringae pv. aceris]MCH5488911.1 phosphatase PAP2 family protein [Pseudomonas syringae pv. syringae]MDF5890528.1 phosphatase PAP2 family protein [Pseudomonas syringae pv. syringae]MDO1459911.1 phosphatase PAP2 family protein [Pseudomonas syringae pv. syringae]POR67357.1 phosphatidic acid phosphatase [Pseudomonas syringae pv. syringae]
MGKPQPRAIQLTTSSSARLRFYGINLGVPVFFALLVFVTFDLTTIDRQLTDLFFDSTAGVFPIGQSHLFENITHRWARILPNWTGELAIIGAMLSFVWPLLEKYDDSRLARRLTGSRLGTFLRFARRHRLDFFFVIVAFALSTAMIHYLKSHTSVYCPVETTLYGGSQAHIEWFRNFNLLHEAGAGRCWPGGHASSAFSLLALYFVARRYCWRHSNILLAGILLLGMIYGTTRVLQGWHFMSHTFWAGIVVWLSTLLVALCFYGRSRLQQPIHQAVAVNRPDAFVTQPADSLVTGSRSAG